MKNIKGNKKIKEIKNGKSNPEIMDVLRRCKGGAHKYNKGNRSRDKNLAIEDSMENSYD